MKDQQFWGIPISGPDGRSGEDVVEILENHCAGLVWVCIVYKQIHGIWYMVYGTWDGWMEKILCGRLTGAKRREWRGMGVAGIIIHNDYGKRWGMDVGRNDSG